MQNGVLFVGEVGVRGVEEGADDICGHSKQSLGLPNEVGLLCGHDPVENVLLRV